MKQFEYVAFAGDAAAPMVAVDGARAWHYAPGRWLVVLPEGATLAAAVPLAAAAQGVFIEVSGKYAAVRFAGEEGRRTLAATVNLAAVLPPGRDCAAVTLFDAPAILMREEGAAAAGGPAGAPAFLVWVTRSHVRDFTAAADRASRNCEKMPG